ncbi:hypothetical protein WJX82_006789 [Trebouxia sp. C0006]
MATSTRNWPLLWQLLLRVRLQPSRQSSCAWRTFKSTQRQLEDPALRSACGTTPLLSGIFERFFTPAAPGAVPVLIKHKVATPVVARFDSCEGYFGPLTRADFGPVEPFPDSLRRAGARQMPGSKENRLSLSKEGTRPRLTN